MPGKSSIFVLITAFYVGPLAPPALAAENAPASAQAVVDRNELEIGDTLTLTVNVSAPEQINAGEPDISGLKDFEILNSWNSSSHSSRLVQTPNGMKFENSSSELFNFMLSPKHEGKLTIPSLEVTANGKKIKTQPIFIQVAKAGSGIKSRQGRGQRANPNLGMDDEDPTDDVDQLFQQLMQRHGIPRGFGQLPPGFGNSPPGAQPRVQALPKNLNEALSVQVEVDKTEVYEGEQILANWYIFTRGNLLSLDRLKFPDLKGFWKEIIEEVPALNFTSEVVNGVPYRRALLASHALFPIKAGNSVIDEYKIKGQIQVPSSTFGSFGFGQPYTFQRSSDRINIKVKPLPTENKPKDFTGAVGQFEVTAAVEGKQFPVNQPFNLKIRFTGNGNAKLIELPDLQLPAGTELYDTKSESKFFKNGTSYKEFTVLVIPRQEGTIHLPSLHFSMFDPQLKQYVSKSSPAIEVEISANKNGAAIADTRLQTGKNGSEKVGPAESELMLQPKIVARDLALPWWLWVMAYFGAAAFLVIYAKKNLGPRAKGHNLLKNCNRRLLNIKQFEQNGDYREVGREASNLIYQIFGKITGKEAEGSDLKALLNSAPVSIRNTHGEVLLKLIDTFQILCFAPEEALGKLREKDNLHRSVAKLEQVLISCIKLSASDEGT